MDTVEEVKRRIDLVEYIGRVTRLQKSGRNFRGLCPFHTEKTPSFYVFPDRGSWRCFGSCGEGGDLLSFVQKRENLEFRAALHQLAAEAGVEITPESAARRSRGEHLSAILSAAVDFYQRCFREPRGDAARTYIFEKRGLKPDAVETFRIGWAPDEWRLLRDYLTGRGYDERDCVAAGLLVESEHGGQPYDRFRGRVIIPIADERGQYVAMGGRGLQSEEPKYLNSPQTEIFDKGRTLFGLHLAAAAIRQARTVVVVEGYMDVIGPYQAGFQNVVATMGTSLTEDHVVLLKRFARRVVLAMDPDAAGLAAAERAGGLFLGFDSPEGAARAIRSAEALTAGAEIELAVAPLPPGKDPDEVARDSPESWANAIANAAPFAEFLINRLVGDTQVSSPVEARRVVDRLRPVLLGVRDPLERGMYVQRIARRLGVAEAAVLERIRQPVAGGRPRPAPEAREPLSPEEVLLALLLRHPELRHDFRDLPASLFTGALDRELFLRWARAETLGGADDPVAMHARELESRRLPPLSGEEAATAARAKIREITRERVIQHQVAISEQVAEAEREFGAGRVAAIADATWRGVLPLEGDRAVAETVIEDLQLGLSIHRREEPRARR
jgi:DNA primase